MCSTCKYGQYSSPRTHEERPFYLHVFLLSKKDFGKSSPFQTQFLTLNNNFGRKYIQNSFKGLLYQVEDQGHCHSCI